MGITLLVLAAGMGSRYGGLKQLDQLGPHGETMMDYSVFDAIRAGFTRAVFVIRRDFEAEFRERVGKRYSNCIKVEYAFQDRNDLPGGFKCPEGREKPWGTGHAVYAARELLDEPFIALNADDFYGADSFVKAARFLSAPPASKLIRGCICAYTLRNTLSEHGAVSRGICTSRGGLLTQVVENPKIRRDGGRIVSELDGAEHILTGDEATSMNYWGFMPEFVGQLEELFLDFLEKRGGELKSEFYLPFAVDALIHAGKARIDMLRSEASWFGITYREDRNGVCSELKKLAERGEYPEQLFKPAQTEAR